MVLLDQIVFEDEGFGLGVSNNDVQVLDLTDHNPDAPVVIAGILKIGAYAISQAFCLAHV